MQTSSFASEASPLFSLRRVIAFVAAVVLAAVMYLLAVVLAEPLLTTRTATETGADAIVMLGGDGPARAHKAIELYKAGMAPAILISGQDDCVDMRPMFRRAGIPDAVIVSECESGTTWENATFSAPILRRMGVRRAVLVTSWFHQRRSLACFRLAAPEVAWVTVAVPRRRSFIALALSVEGTRVAREHLKLAWYALRYGISLVPDFGPDIKRQYS